MNTFQDSMGNAYSLEYNSSKNVAKIKDPAGNYLKLTYTSLPINEVPFTNLGTITPTPSSNQWTTITVSNTNAFRFVRYLGTETAGTEITEMEFYNTSTNLLSGTAYGTSPASATGQEYDKATDGATNTFFSYGGNGAGFTGLDLGTASVIGKVKFFPRPGYEDKMYHKKFQAANEKPLTITVVSKVETSDGRSVDYNYSAFQDASLTNQFYKVLSSVSYGDGTTATYDYQLLQPYELPLLSHAVDPRVTDNGTDEKFEFEGAGTALGIDRKSVV